MTTVQAASLIHRLGLIRAGDFDIEVMIVDIRDGGWGRTHAQVRPIAGRGDVWVDLNRVELLEG
ncbi:MAG: hypothetical protein KGI54_13205 [Pseudomonadota bacterium]|nr:hypothetical protein [Pseudomonadota bacterium]